MYTSTHFQETDISQLRSLIGKHALGTWVIHSERGFEINHIPFLLDDDHTLIGHVARANVAWQHCQGSGSVVIFTGEQGYVSPNWYPSKQMHHRVVPTWNYAVVHAHGIAEAVDDREWLREVITRLTEVHEAGQPQPWRVTDAPDDHIEKMLGAIVGIRFGIERLEGKFKLSQNRSAADQQGVVNGLRASSDTHSHALADFMTEYQRS